MATHRVVIWPAVSAAALCLLDMVLRLCLNPWEGKDWSIVVHDPGKTFFHLFVLPAAVYVICSHYQWHRDRGIGPGTKAKLALLVLAAVSLTGAVVETRLSFKTRLTAAEDIAERSFRETVAVDRVQHREAVTDKASGTIARDAANKVAAGAVTEAIGQAGSWYQAMSARRVTAMLLSAIGYGLTAYVIWLLAATATGEFPWKSTRGYLFLVITLLGIWPMLNGYSEIWRNFGSPPSSNPAQGLALLMLGFTSLLTTIAFYKSDAEDLVSKIVDAGKNVASGAAPALIYRWSDPTPIFAVFDNDIVTFGVAQLFAGCLLVIAVMVIDTAIRRRNALPPSGQEKP